MASGRSRRDAPVAAALPHTPGRCGPSAGAAHAIPPCLRSKNSSRSPKAATVADAATRTGHVTARDAKWADFLEGRPRPHTASREIHKRVSDVFLVMAPFFLVIFFYDNEPVLTLLSYVPFSAPVGMPMRLVLDQAQWWEPLLSLGIITATITVMVWIGARIYSNSILRIGARVTFKDAVRG